MKTQLLLAAAGLGVRLGQTDRPKALVEIAGKPLLVRTLERLAPLGLTTNAVILYPPGHKDAFGQTLAKAFPGTDFLLCEGGAERQLSVANGLGQLRAAAEIVVIHDAARPFVPVGSVAKSIDAAVEHGAATVAIPVIDTILQGDRDAFLVNTPDRRLLWACQTPQTFRVDVIRTAHTRAQEDRYVGTDDASLVRRMGLPVKLVMGSSFNIKITTPADLELAAFIVSRA